MTEDPRRVHLAVHTLEKPLSDVPRRRRSRLVRKLVHWGSRSGKRLGALLWERELETEPPQGNRRVELDHFHPERTHYEPSGWTWLRRLLPPQAVTADDVFIDFGCGQGRIVYQAAAHYPFRRVIGVDVSAPLVEVARANVEHNRPRLHCQDVELVVADAADYQLPDDVTIAYFYFPFSGRTFERVLENVGASLNRRPRSFRLLFTGPAAECGIERSGRFRLERRSRIAHARDARWEAQVWVPRLEPEEARENRSVGSADAR
jgi:methyltransferase family protein